MTEETYQGWTKPTNSQAWARSIALRAIRAVKERSVVELTDSQAWNILDLAVGERIPQSPTDAAD